MQKRACQVVMRAANHGAWRIALLLVVSMASGCYGPSVSHRNEGMMVGGVLGAGTGAVVGNQLGSPATGAIIGGVSGATIGNIVGSGQDRSEARRAQQRRVIERQAIEKKRQQDEM